MSIPTDLEILNTVYRLYYSSYISFESGDEGRGSKVYVPVDCRKIANELRVDADIVFGRLYYHLDKKYGYKREDGSSVHLFAIKVGKDANCVNFPLMSSVLAGLRQERGRFWIGTVIAILALIVSSVSLTVSITQMENSNKSMQTTAEAAYD